MATSNKYLKNMMQAPEMSPSSPFSPLYEPAQNPFGSDYNFGGFNDATYASPSSGFSAGYKPSPGQDASQTVSPANFYRNEKPRTNYGPPSALDVDGRVSDTPPSAGQPTTFDTERFFAGVNAMKPGESPIKRQRDLMAGLRRRQLTGTAEIKLAPHLLRMRRLIYPTWKAVLASETEVQDVVGELREVSTLPDAFFMH